MTSQATTSTDPAARILAIFGGITKTAEALGKPVTTVQGWKDRKRIPPEHWREIMDVARDQKRKRLRFEDFIPDKAAS